MPRHNRLHALTLLALALPGGVLAGPNDPCGYQGRLISLGQSGNGALSLWLSAITVVDGSRTQYLYPGEPPFPVGTAPVDQWPVTKPGLRFSLSPFPNDTHTLGHVYAAGQSCVIDSSPVLQRPDITLPPAGGNGGSGGGVGGGGGTGGGGGGTGGSGGGTGGGSDPIRNIVTSINVGTVTAYQTGALSISDRVVAGLDLRRRFPKADETWQTWADVRHTDLSDDRNGIDASGHANSLLIGVHRAFGSDLVAGLAAATSRTRFGAFDSTVRNDGDAAFVGPYAGYRLSANWLLDGWAAWGRTDNDTELDVLNGDYRTTTWFASANLTGDYAFGDYLFRPKLALFYSHSTADAFAYTGTLPYAGQVYHLTLRVNDDSFEYATSELSGDISRVFTTAGGTRITPALRLGVRYDIERPNDGKILDRNLELESTSPWGGSARLGLAVEPERHLRFELVTGYYSIGRQDVDLWDVRLNAAMSF